MARTTLGDVVASSEHVQAQLFAAIVGASEDAIVAKTLDGVIASWNVGAVRMYGYLAEEAIGQPMTMLCPPDRQGEVADILGMVRTGQRVAHYETMRVRKDGVTIPVSVSVSPIHDQDGSPVGAASIARDIAELRRLRALEARLQRARDIELANQNLTAFAYSVTHDLRTPLRALGGYSGVLLEEYADVLGEEGRGYVEGIAAAAVQMSKIIDAMLLLSRLPRTQVRPQTVDLSAQVGQIAEQLQLEEPHRHVRFEIQHPVQARADPALIHVILENLVENAWKFTSHRQDALIEFGTTPTAHAPVCCYVRDNGAGFDPAYVGKLFQPFQRLHTAAQFPGTGIGLATVKQLVELHGGRTWAEGKEGEGAAFYFTLKTEEDDHPAGPL